MNKESACIVMCIVLKNFAKMLDLEREFDLTVCRHKQRTPSKNEHHTPLQMQCFLRFLKGSRGGALGCQHHFSFCV